MVQRDVKYVPGFFKIIDEVVVNAADNKVFVFRDPAVGR
jgi:DNA topoisomerase-2